MENLTGFGEILEKSLNEIYIFDAKTLRFIMVNRGARENLGYSSEELKQLTPIDLKPEFPEQRFREFVAPLLAGKTEKLIFETFHLRKDKTTYDVKVHLQLFKLNRKKVFTAIIDDISEKNLAKVRLKQSESHFRSLVSNIPDIITRFDLDLKIIYISDSILEHSGKQPSFYIGKTQYELGFPENIVDQYQNQLMKAMLTGKAVKYESKLPKNKEWEYYYNTIVPEFDMKGKLTSILAISKEITKQKKLELKLKDNIKSLEQASTELSHRNRQLEDFANIASHNLRSPIGNLKMLLELYDQEQDQEKKEFFVQKLKEVTQRLNGTVDTLTEVVNIKKNINSKREIINFEEILQEIRSSLSAQMMATGAEISSNFSQCKFILYPKVYLESILLNLVTNAIKYRSPKRTPKIHFETFVKKDRIVLSCCDNGLGIDMERHGHKLFGLNKTFHRHKEARGVGLFITKNQIESLGGSIEAKSEVDKGTEFIISFHKDDFCHEKNRHRLYSR